MVDVTKLFGRIYAIEHILIIHSPSIIQSNNKINVLKQYPYLNVYRQFCYLTLSTKIVIPTSLPKSSLWLPFFLDFFKI